MHQLIVTEASGSKKTGRQRLRLIGNAAGPLLPSLANSLRNTFWYVYAILPCTFLPDLLQIELLSWQAQMHVICFLTYSITGWMPVVCSTVLC